MKTHLFLKSKKKKKSEDLLGAMLLWAWGHTSEWEPVFPLVKIDSSVKCNECYAMLRTEHYGVFQFGQPTSLCIFYEKWGIWSFESGTNKAVLEEKSGMVQVRRAKDIEQDHQLKTYHQIIFFVH